MKEHPLTNEKTFNSFLDSLSCNGCNYFIDGKCSHKKGAENEGKKLELVKLHNKIGKPFNIEWAKNINNNYTCRSYECKKAILQSKQ